MGRLVAPVPALLPRLYGIDRPDNMHAWPDGSCRRFGGGGPSRNGRFAGWSRDSVVQVLTLGRLD
jgi:hypothetical protein